jgi:hypothetical protein
MNEENEKKRAIIIHSAGILKNKRGYIFFGPPESGKSTIANFSKRFKVLHDDMNIVTIDKERVFVEGIPFNPRQSEFKNGSGPLSMICSLHKNNSVKLEKGSPGEFTEKVLPEVFLPLTILSEDRKEAFQYLLESVKKLGESIPYYRLYFRKDESFWEIINKMEEDYGKH